MKKRIILLTLICTILFISACGGESNANVPTKDNGNAENLESYLESMDMPKMLSIAFDPKDVSQLTSAKEYTAKWLEFDTDQVVDTLLRNPVLEVKDYAMGPQMIAGDGQGIEEYLTIYDGVLHGGLSYSFDFSGEGNSLVGKLQDVASLYPGFPDQSEQAFPYTSMDDYKTNYDLDFIPYKEAVAETEKILTECGFPSLLLQNVYSLDVETMQNHYHLYKEITLEEEPEEYSWSKDDEAYLIHFRQNIDGIPCINVKWEEGVRDEPTETPIYTIYSRNGLVNISADSMYSKVSETKEENIISPVQAFQIYIDEYMESIPIRETKILYFELNYVGIHGDKGIQLVPAWVLCTSQLDESLEFYEYTYYVLNAFTGKRIRTAVDSQ